MPHLAQFVLAATVFVPTVIACIVLIVRRGAAAARIAAAARLSAARVDRIVHEAQDMLIPIREIAPVSAPTLALVAGRLRIPSTAPGAAGSPSTITSAPWQALRSIRSFDGTGSQVRQPSAPCLRTDQERGRS